MVYVYVELDLVRQTQWDCLPSYRLRCLPIAKKLLVSSWFFFVKIAEFEICHIDLMQISWLLISINYFINQRNEPHHEKERVKISDTAKFQSCWPNTREMADI